MLREHDLPRGRAGITSQVVVASLFRMINVIYVCMRVGKDLEGRTLNLTVVTSGQVSFSAF